jgi:hypothetical protein
LLKCEAIRAPKPPTSPVATISIIPLSVYRLGRKKGLTQSTNNDKQHNPIPSLDKLPHMQPRHDQEDDETHNSAGERRHIAVHFPVEAWGFGRVLPLPVGQGWTCHIDILGRRIELGKRFQGRGTSSMRSKLCSENTLRTRSEILHHSSR